MSWQIAVEQVQQYSTNVAMLLQQQQSRLRGTAQEQAFTGKAASFLDQFGAVSPVYNLGRHSDTPIIDVPQDRRWVFPNDAEYGALIDQQDRLRLLVDPSGPYTTAAAMAFGRAFDDFFISAFFNTNYTGENSNSNSTGTLYAYNSNSQSVAATTGGTAACGLNVAKLRAAKRKMLEAEVDVDSDPLYIAITAKQHDDLLNEAQAINLDYTDRPVLVEGKIMRFMGFNFVHSERIPGGGSFAANTPGNALATGSSDGTYTTGSRWMVPCWAKSGMSYGIWSDVQTQIAQRPDKRFAWQIYATMTIGASRTEEKRCVLINCV